ncbi:MalY/PatB family protein [Thomasclavelia sp.]|uniref:MalY/PatB family protein n=1 Tax=Thomasclavelia sp. TaxID=3025757 RepID=UPI0025DD8149|nr:MalY/PatB family protein [Thomasclavelia sp.]
MKYDFETLIDRTLKGSAKWQGMKEINPDVPDGIVPLSVADCDLKLAPEIQAGLIEFMQNDPVLGYSAPTDEYYQSVINWMMNKFNYSIEKEWIVLSNGVVPALGDGVGAFTKADEGVIIFTPVYYPFYKAIENNGRKIVKCPLINNEGHYEIDFALFEKLAKDSKNTLLILCSPHNPISRVWSKEELEKVAKICLENNIIILSDEIHEDLIMPGYKHTPVATLSEEIADITVTCTAPSKSFNIAGLQGSNIIIKNPELREKFVLQQSKKGFHTLNTISFEATRLAYSKGAAWLDAFKELIYQNYQMLTAFIQEKLPKVKVTPLEGTYLVWLDFRAYNLDYKELEKKMIHANIYLDEGYVFGDEGKGFERVNIATPSKVLQEALNRIYEEFKGE